MMKNIGWHLRKWSDGTKTKGGSFGGGVSMETADRLASTFLDVEIMPSGKPVFIDKKTKERVWLYFSIDASETEKGKQALEQYRVEQQKKHKMEEERRTKVMMALDGFSTEELEKMLGIK